MAIMSKMVRKAAVAVEEVSVAGAKNRLSELLGRVAYGVPPESLDDGHGLADVTGWLDDTHPFITGVEGIVAARGRHLPRALKRPARGH
jgi:antitoxin (DNA-binding transcriptional repressor) of toxin-antitoxin stability system